MASTKYMKDLLAAPCRRIGGHATPASGLATKTVEELESTASVGATPKANRWAMSCMVGEQRSVEVSSMAGSHGLRTRSSLERGARKSSRRLWL